jgi:hypothetical protein
MLKGAIDHVSSTEVGGWLYSEAASVRNRTVLAFLENACIGAGRIEIFREDLAEAGLGDGFLGFRFPVHLSSPDDAGRVAIKLEGSDALIVQASARLMHRHPVAPPTPVTTRTLASIEWMRSRGWLEQAEYDFLRLMSRFGAYDLSLRHGTPEERRSGNGTRDPAQVTREFFELLCAACPKVGAETLTAEVGLQPMIEQYRRGAIEPVVSLWSPQNGVVALVEGSHLDAHHESANDTAVGAVDYAVGPDRLLFLDLRCRLRAKFSAQVRSHAIAIGET